MAIWVTGDIHGNPSRLSTDIFPEQKEMTKEDYIILLGDFGLVWDYRGESKMRSIGLTGWKQNRLRHYFSTEIMKILIV